MSMSLLGKLLRLLIKERMEYRADFILAAIAQMIAYGGEFLVIWLFLRKFNHISGWTWPEISILYSMGLLTYALGASFSYVQMREVEDKVQSGKLDHYLVKPVNPYFYLICRGLNLSYIAHLILAGSIFIWSWANIDMDWTFIKILYLILSIISSSMIYAAIMTLIGAMSFIWIKTNYLFDLFFNFKDFISYPIQIYGYFIQLLLTFVLPLAFVNFFPSAFLLSNNTSFLTGSILWFTPIIGPAVYYASYKFWMYGINKYQGAGG
ncbi:ABC transporter permease [Paenibacillus durus]|uniref:ABC transporter permease n=1 Tax=Paenibacillus durus TaxID=44251 RepID=UPI000ABC2A13|nr:ABC-2 family transporter protein [Paenibacillus durus]